MQPPRDIMEPFWVNVLTQESRAVPHFQESDNDVKELWQPITMEEVKAAKLSSRTAAGPDGLSAKDLARIPSAVQLCLYNLFMWCEQLPESLLASRTIFIPKRGHEDEHDKYRPITVSSVIVRTFNRILARRLERAMPVDERQRGFRTGIDGCRDNIFQLDMILRQHHLSLKPLYMASLDVAKAFPSVSHPSLLAAMSSFGVPPAFVQCVRHVYERGHTILQGQGWTSGRIYPKRGVRQGDPLSSPIFNLLTHRLLNSLSNDIGVRFGQRKTNASAFVDYVNLYATTPRGLQCLIDQMQSFLLSCGMKVNIDKSFTLGFRPSGRSKINTVDTHSRFYVGNEQEQQRELRRMRREDSWTYLGVQFTWAGRKNIKPHNIIEPSGP